MQAENLTVKEIHAGQICILRGVETESQDHPAIYEENNKSGTSTMAEN